MKKIVYVNHRLEVELQPETRSHSEKLNVLRELAIQIKRHVDDVFPEERFDIREECEFCGSTWSKTDDGGMDFACCAKDAAQREAALTTKKPGKE